MDDVMEKAAKTVNSTILAYVKEPLGFGPQNSIHVRGLLGLQTKQLHYQTTFKTDEEKKKATNDCWFL